MTEKETVSIGMGAALSVYSGVLFVTIDAMRQAIEKMSEQELLTDIGMVVMAQKLQVEMAEQFPFMKTLSFDHISSENVHFELESLINQFGTHVDFKRGSNHEQEYSPAQAPPTRLFDVEGVG